MMKSALVFLMGVLKCQTKRDQAQLCLALASLIIAVIALF